mgnify:CR=1 FL=1
MNLLKSLGDRLLSLFVTDLKAGACVPEVGDVCKTLHYTCTGLCK